MLLRLRRAWLRDHAAHLAGLQLLMVVLLTATVSIAAVSADRADEPALTRGPAAPVPALAAASASTSSEAGETIRLQDLDPDAARLWNAAIPVSTLPNAPARPFRLSTDSVLDDARALDCMTAAIYYEAAFESTDGQRAVAQVVLNRLRHPAYPKTVCGVVFQGSERSTGCQFTFTCDGALKTRPVEAGWVRARHVAQAALDGYVMKKVGNSTHYHASYVAPYWSPNLVKTATIGAHIFYRWTGGWGMPPAFGGRHTGSETAGVQIATIQSLSGTGGLQLAAIERATPPQIALEVEPIAEPVAAAVESEMVVASAVVAQTPELTQPVELNWAGQPKPKAPPRLARPGAARSLAP